MHAEIFDENFKYLNTKNKEGIKKLFPQISKGKLFSNDRMQK